MAPPIEDLAREPSPESWRLLCEALAALPESDALALIDRISPDLERWPEELRATMCGMDWDDRFLDGNPDPRSSIVRYFRYDHIFIGRYGGIMVRGRNITEAAIAGLCRGPGVDHLTRINLNGNSIGEVGARLFAASERFEQLRWLELERCELDGDAVAALAQAPFYGRLEHLSLSSNELDGDAIAGAFTSDGPRELELTNNPLGEDGAATIARRIAPATRALVLDGCELDADAARALARIPHALASLSLGGNDLGDAGLAGLAAGTLTVERLAIPGDTIGAPGVRALLAARWPLTLLDLRDNALDDAAAELIASHGPRTLEQLDLADNDITAAGLAALVGSPQLAGLTHLDLSTNRIGEVGDLAPTLRGLVVLRLRHARLAGSTRALAKVDADSLRELYLVGNALDATALQDLTAASWFGGLTTLDLSANPLGPAAGVVIGTRLLEQLILSDTGLGDDGLVALCATELRPKHLALDGCELTDRGIEALARSPLAASIETLRLANNAITDRGALALVRAGTFGRLRSIFIGDNQLGDDGVVALATWEGPVQIVVDGNLHGKRGDDAIDALPRRCCP